MGVIMEALVRSSIADGLRKGELGIEFAEPRNLLPKLLENAALYKGRGQEARQALADAITKLVHEPLVKLRAGDRLRHKSTGRTARAMHPLGDGWTTWQVLTDDTDALENWPTDQIEAAGETEPQPLPGGRQGAYEGAPFQHEAEQQKKAAYYASQEGQRALAKSIRPGPPPSSFCGFEAQRSALRKAAAERGFKLGQRLIHVPSGRRGVMIAGDGKHAIVRHDDGSLHEYANEELAETLEAPGYANAASTHPQIKVRQVRPGLSEMFLSR